MILAAAGTGATVQRWFGRTLPRSCGEVLSARSIGGTLPC
jgi:hypothetical protein